MQVLVLGGSQFIGRHLVDALLAAGHAVSVFNRGVTPADLPAAVERLRGDRDAGTAGLQALHGRRWHACVDLSGYTPRQVRPAVETLRAQVEHYAYVSAAMSYGDAKHRPVREDHPQLAPAPEHETVVDGRSYGALKVACERIVESVFGARRCALLRPQIVSGPGDPSGRYAYWVQRAQRPGPMLAPGDGSDHLQLIDVRDLVRFIVGTLERRLSGPFNLAGPRVTWAEFLALLGAPDLVWVPAAVLLDADLAFGELPMYRPERGTFAGLMDLSNERARAAGLTLTEPAVTARDMQAWCAGREPPLPLTPEREAALIALARR